MIKLKQIKRPRFRWEFSSSQVKRLLEIYLQTSLMLARISSESNSERAVSLGYPGMSQKDFEHLCTLE